MDGYHSNVGLCSEIVSADHDDDRGMIKFLVPLPVCLSRCSVLYSDVVVVATGGGKIPCAHIRWIAK